MDLLVNYTILTISTSFLFLLIILEQFNIRVESIQ